MWLIEFNILSSKWIQSTHKIDTQKKTVRAVLNKHPLGTILILTRSINWNIHFDLIHSHSDITFNKNYFWFMYFANSVKLPIKIGNFSLTRLEKFDRTTNALPVKCHCRKVLSCASPFSCEYFVCIGAKYLKISGNKMTTLVFFFFLALFC